MRKLHKNILPVLAAAVFMVIVGILLFFGKGANTPSPQKSPQPKNIAQNAETTKELAVYLKAMNHYKQTGSASLTEKNGRVTIGISTTGEPKNVVQFANIYSGTCESLGNIKFPLANIINGSSQTDLETTIVNLQNSGPLALNINRTQGDNKNSVSCANLEFNNSTSPTNKVPFEIDTKESTPNINY